MTYIKGSTIEALFVWLLGADRPSDHWELLDHDLVGPLFWLQARYRGHGRAEHFYCPIGALHAFARRHPELVRENACGRQPIALGLELTAYLDSLAAAEAVDAVLGRS